MRRYLKFLICIPLIFLSLAPCHAVGIKLPNIRFDAIVPSTKNGFFSKEVLCRVALAGSLQCAVGSGIVSIHLLKKAYRASLRSNEITELAKIANRALGIKADEPSELIRSSVLFLLLCIASAGLSCILYRGIINF